MIPTIETIIEDLLAGTITKQQAIQWLNMHAEGVANELRDYFAGKAMQSFITTTSQEGADPDIAMKAISVMSYSMADKMLAERSKP